MSIRTAAHRTLSWARQSTLRRPILRGLVWTHNTSYHLLSFFASKDGLHPKHQILQYHQFFVDHVTSTDHILDVGAGNGAVAYDVAGKAATVLGIDISAQNVAKARQRYVRPNLSFIVGDATTYQFDQTFDAIILSNVLEHIEHRVLFLQKLKALAPTILIRVPMISRDWLTVYKKQEGFEYRLDDTHYIEYTEALFRGEMAQAGLSITHLHTAFGELYAVVTADPTRHRA